MRVVTCRLMLVLLIVGALAGRAPRLQTVQLRRVMQTKLAHAQRILGDVVTNDWLGLQTDAAALQSGCAGIPPGQCWCHPGTSGKPPRSCMQPKTSSTPQNVATWKATPLAYVSLTLSCVQCHRYVARMRIAK